MSGLPFRHRHPGLLGDPFMGYDPDHDPNPDMPISSGIAEREAPSEDAPAPVQPVVSYDRLVVTNPLAREPIRPEAECVRTTFHIHVDWQLGCNLATASNMTTKPDGQPGWASYFLRQGFTVYIVDMPPSGRSNSVTVSHCDSSYYHSMSIQTVESELTAPEKVTATNPRIKYPAAKFHDKWPGSGLHHDDPYFANYYASLTPICLKKVQRQTLAQDSLQELLKHTGKAFLIGEGTGSMMAWLATDVEPDLVAGVIAIEPTGPPFGTTIRTPVNGHRIFTQIVRHVPGVRVYGLTDITLTYDPPANFHGTILPSDHEMPLDLVERMRPDTKGTCYLQRNLHEDEIIFNHETGQHEMSGLTRFRELMNLKKVPQAVVTAHASSHTTYDWTTVAFMVQAGVPVQWIKLDENQIFGNGHLMFLETNSDDIAGLLTKWIDSMTPETFRGNVHQASQQVHASPEPAELPTARLPSVDPMEGVEPTHHNNQPEQVNPAQPEHVGSTHHGALLPSVEADHAGYVKLEQAEARINSARFEHTDTPHHHGQSVGLQEGHADLAQPEHAESHHYGSQSPDFDEEFADLVHCEHDEIPYHSDQSPGPQENHVVPAQTEHEELPPNDQSPGSEDDVDLVPSEYPATPYNTPNNSAQNSSDRSYEPSSGSGRSNQSSDSHHDNQPAGSRQDSHSLESHHYNRSPSAQGNGGNPGQSEPTSDISYINSSPSQSDDEIVISQAAVTPQNSAQSSLGYSQDPSSSSAYEQSTNKRPAPSSSGRRSLASDPGSSLPATSWGPAPKRPRMSTSPLGSNYAPSATNATPGGSWYADDSPQLGRDQSVESPITSLAMLRPAHPAGPAQLRPRVVTTLSSPIFVSPPPVGYTPHKEFVREYGLVDLSPVRGQPRSVARDALGHSPRDQSTQGRSDQANSHQGYTQGHSTQGYRTQGYDTQGQSTQGYHTQSSPIEGYGTQGHATQSQSAQGYSTQVNSTQGLSAHGYTTQIYPHSVARFECQPGTAEESIAAMARVNKARVASNVSRSAAAADDVHFSPFKHPRTLPAGQKNQPNETNTREAPQAKIPAPAAQPMPERPRTPEAPDSEAEGEDWYSMFGCPPRATPPSPSPAPRGSSNPGSSIVTLGTPIRDGSSKRHASK
ncbi:uncharacterized protein NECHADRAFT_75500 [Fusarium vanettenii 77-13-4]|uniref:AB hydrolase-1 domain-containing protein n=1 Tax=Fusarium vanettenii (strain ATCC MYA-4622 / CBS 123669 / FGSC 9596 / NRRL 45880 / 77-13-4) TaxID=660122 RepID=C7YIZ6_FUSV7|nr:uncharacterized protein NECHADRAFT_75500 [Fusarium vanettenii 77-13-4]EEU48180.1 hypothetical protein NECHADRAFT_75500 [Fusarium vanettenii 77-13-4]